MAVLTGESNKDNPVLSVNQIILRKGRSMIIDDIDYKFIDYFGTKIGVSKRGDVFWNGTKRNINYNKDGYSVCSIDVPEKGWRTVRVARLVALAYIPNPDNLPEVNHKDYDRTNSNVENLEWVTHADNVKYSMCNRPDFTGSNNPNYGNRKLSEIYAKDKQLAKEKQGRQGLQNGRCRGIKVFSGDVMIAEFDYIAQCCEYIAEHYAIGVKPISIRGRIDASIRNGTTYKGLTFVKE